MDKRDYYEILGLNKDATESEIKKAYRKLVLEHHPDKGGDEEKFKEIAEAYDVLSTPEKKQNYDTYGHNGPQGSHTGHGYDMNDIFSQFGHMFGRRKQQQQRPRGGNIRLHIELSLEYVFTGIEKKIKFNRQKNCTDCNGQGGSDFETCKLCNGQGVRLQVQQTTLGMMQTQVICNGCNGDGKNPKNKCVSCNGQGIKEGEEVVEINIPIGINETDMLKMNGLGHAVKGGTNGDLLIYVKIKEHKSFSRDDSNLNLELKLNYHQLVLGDKVEIPTIEGSKIRFEIPKYSQVGKVIRIPNKGLKQLHNEDARGHMYVTLDIIIPEEIDSETEEIIKKLGEKVESVNKN